MMPVGLFDEVSIDDAPYFSVKHEPPLLVPPEQTTVWKAATLLAEELHAELNLCVSIKVSIPEKAGLGGSSADAGATLRLLAQRWGLDALDPRVVDVARRVGADVAFFLDPVPSLHLGAGDMLTETFPELALPVALVMPPGPGVSAKAAYEEFDRCPTEPAAYGPLCDALRAGDAGAVPGLLHNNLAPAAKASAGLCRGRAVGTRPAGGPCGHGLGVGQLRVRPVRDPRGRPRRGKKGCRARLVVFCHIDGWNSGQSLLISSLASGCGSVW